MSEASAHQDVYSSAHFSLQLDGTIIGTLRSIDGGSVKTEVATYQAGDYSDVWKQLAKPKYEDIKFVTALAGARPLWQWMKDFIDGKGTRRSGALLAADYNYIEKARRTFKEALIAAIDFPKFDANDKGPANITVTISPEKIVYEKGSGKPLDDRDPSNAAQQHIAACNFEFLFDGVGSQTTARVTKVDAFSVKAKIIEYHHGTRLEAAKTTGKLEWPNLVFYLPEPDAEPFRAIHMKSVVGERATRTSATLSFFNNAKEVRGTFKFTGCHIFNVSPEKSDVASEDVRMVKVECQVEKVDLDIQ